MAKVEMLFKLFSTLTFLQFASSSQVLDKTFSNLTGIREIKELAMNSTWDIIDLSHNSIKWDKLDLLLLRNQTRLETLRLSSNPTFNGQGDERIFEQNTLKNFECAKCGFVEIQSQTFTGLVSLTELHLSENKINRINVDAFKSNKNLKFLDLTSNKLTTLPPSTFDGLLNFEALYLTKNRIELLVNKPILKSDSLKHLKLDECDMTAFYPQTFSQLRNLEKLNLSQNQIESFPAMPFKSNDELKSLFIEGNRIKSISTDILDRLPQMEELCFDNNTFVESPEFTKFVKKYNESHLRTTNCSDNAQIFIKALLAGEKSAKFVIFDNNKGVSDFFIGSFISFVLIFQGAVIVYLLFQLIKMTKFEKLDGDVNYANTFLNDDEIYVRIK